jgi:hypothetical protein
MDNIDYQAFQLFYYNIELLLEGVNYKKHSFDISNDIDPTEYLSSAYDLSNCYAHFVSSELCSYIHSTPDKLNCDYKRFDQILELWLLQYNCKYLCVKPDFLHVLLMLSNKSLCNLFFPELSNIRNDIKISLNFKCKNYENCQNDIFIEFNDIIDFIAVLARYQSLYYDFMINTPLYKLDNSLCCHNCSKSHPQYLNESTYSQKEFIKIIDDTVKFIELDIANKPDEVAVIIQNMNYKDFLKTIYWKIISYTVKQRAGNRCVLCQSTNKLQAHHSTYDIRGYEYQNMDKIVCLCDKCHHHHHKG